MGTWNSRGLRGSALEELINRTNEQYREKGLALIQKIPTRSALMQKNVRQIPLLSRISIRIRSLLCRILKNRAGSPFC